LQRCLQFRTGCQTGPLFLGVIIYNGLAHIAAAMVREGSLQCRQGQQRIDQNIRSTADQHELQR
jgi:hypothetical protein